MEPDEPPKPVARRRYEPRLTDRAREMRHHSAPAERILWSKLRGCRLQGFRFRRQQPMGSYVADFYCAECRLVIELDGDSHSDQVDYDRRRDEWMSAQGLLVLRYPNPEIFDNLHNVLEAILLACEQRQGGSAK